MVQKHAVWYGSTKTEAKLKCLNYRVRGIVSIMDLIMFDAQRQGRLSFYMVR